MKTISQRIIALNVLIVQLLRIISGIRKKIQRLRAKIPSFLQENQLIGDQNVTIVTLTHRGSILDNLRQGLGIELSDNETEARTTLRSFGVLLDENTVRLLTQSGNLFVEDGHGSLHRRKNVFLTKTAYFIHRTTTPCKHNDTGGVSVHLSFDTLCVTNLGGVYGEGTRIFLRQPTHQS